MNCEATRLKNLQKFFSSMLPNISSYSVGCATPCGPASMGKIYQYKSSRTYTDADDWYNNQ